jgi:hypothetical protein
MRQLHGFLYEIQVINKYNLIKCEKYISEYDAFTCSGIPVQIKYRKFKSSVCFGDFKRNMLKEKDFILVVGTWKETHYNKISEDIYYINYEKFNDMCFFNEINTATVEMKNISNNHYDDTNWKAFILKYKKIYPKENIIKINFKRDHKSQKRIQCSISNKNYEIFKQQFKDIKL